MGKHDTVSGISDTVSETPDTASGIADTVSARNDHRWQGKETNRERTNIYSYANMTKKSPNRIQKDWQEKTTNKTGGGDQNHTKTITVLPDSVSAGGYYENNFRTKMIKVNKK